MKKSQIVIFLLVSGVFLVALSIILAFVAVNNTDIIGGADWSTFSFVFFRKHGGLYLILATAGVLLSTSSLIVHSVRKK